jgi:hydrogenase maturation protein HypF
MNRPLPLTPTPVRRIAIAVRGVVQGVGFRPFVYQAARTRGLSGWVRNEADVVRIEVQGHAAAVDDFVDAVRHAHPPQARIENVDIDEQQPVFVAEGVFEIRHSTGEAAPRPTIPADLATCRECLTEIREPHERRHNYPFTNCTNCGPRWSIIEHLPYDRPRTSMASFAMCPGCRAEYENPTDRRFHAQPIACPRCGPTLQLLDREDHEIATGEAALDAAVQALLAGRVVAIKGIGGFQLLVDATNAEAVAVLRQRKRRPDRPFALMLPSLEEVRRYCEVSDDEAHELCSHQSPILLLRALPSPLSPLLSPLAPSVAPGNPYLGVMLPYTPLHHLLMSAVARPIVCTSGNLSEEPMAITTEDAIARLGPIADVILTHNRPIVRPVDDSIVRVSPDGVQVLRRARGFAPLPIEVHTESPTLSTILAVGGHLKNTVALALSRVRETHHETPQLVRCTHPTQVVMSAHIGDLDSVLSVEVFRRAIDDLLEFFQVTPDAVVCDLHPDYASTRHAEQLAGRWGVPLLRVQHHHAHVAACMAEHGLRGPVLGFSWDGTGYGPDGTVWGGEMLLCERAEYQRVAHLRTFPLPGGERAVREPRRSALGVLFEILGPRAAEHAAAWFNSSQLDSLLSMLERQVNSPRTSSMGRLFDAVAAICGLSPVISFEGQAAMALEFAADESEQAAYNVALSACEAGVSQGHDIVADWEPLLLAVLADRAAGVPVARISARFHNALAEMAVDIARRVDPAMQMPVVLSGGCFQNALLLERVRARLLAAGYAVYTHHQVPPGDGGVALGQVFVALQSKTA